MSLINLNAFEILKLFNSNKISAIEYVSELISHIKLREPNVEAWAFLNEDLVKSQAKIIDEINFDKFTNEIKDLDVIYPSIGENLSFLKSIKKKKNLNYNFIVRDGDEFCWQFSNKGYFNFKSNIPKIIQKIT